MSNQENTGKLEVRAYPIAEPKGNILGSATIAMDTPIGTLAVRDIRIMNGQNGPFISMPQMRDKEGDYKDLVSRPPRRGAPSSTPLFWTPMPPPKKRRRRRLLSRIRSGRAVKNRKKSLRRIRKRRRKKPSLTDKEALWIQHNLLERRAETR